MVPLITLIDYAATILEILGVAVILTGAVYATAVAAAERLKQQADQGIFDNYRRRLGRAILLGLEFLIAADIINTVAIQPSLENVAVLATVILIRTFLSFTLEVEMTGRWPWQAGNDRPEQVCDRGDRAKQEKR
jgi:uncharacterized membrane protein